MGRKVFKGQCVGWRVLYELEANPRMSRALCQSAGAIWPILWRHACTPNADSRHKYPAASTASFLRLTNAPRTVTTLSAVIKYVI